MAAAVAASSRCVLLKWDESRLLGDGSLVEGIEVPGVDGADEMGMWCSGCNGPPWVSKWCCWAIRACIRCCCCSAFALGSKRCGGFQSVESRRLARRTRYTSVECVDPAKESATLTGFPASR